MNRVSWIRYILIFTCLLRIHADTFVNFETAPVHPVALSPDGNTLAVCNLPDARVEIFDLRSGAPRLAGSVFTGLDPVTARFNGNGELWVVNHISDSITVVDVIRRAAVATLSCFDAPADVVFTRAGEAYVSHAGDHAIKIFDTRSRQQIGALDLVGNRAKAMAVSADGSQVYVAFQESGNGTTIIGPEIVPFGSPQKPYATDLPGAPHHGLNPAPNAGDSFSPAVNTNIPSSIVPPRVAMIVRKENGRWMDDNGGDWTEFVSGTNAPLTGRVAGWDLADHDIAVIKTANRSVTYIQNLMNICMDVSVNPASGQLVVIGSDSINEVRFEPNLKGIFAQMKLAIVDPNSFALSVSDLNPHLDYAVRTIPRETRKLSIGDPRGITWNSTGTRAYVTGMGSNNILMVDANGVRVGTPAEIPEGPTGLVVDDLRHQVYVFCRFASKLVTLDADTLGTLNTIELHDSTPQSIRVGRNHFYNTVETSGLGHLSCATCHVDGRADRLAWDLGDPAGDVIPLGLKYFELGTTTNDYHPMKGPMVTQTLRDIIGHEPFHWRSDRMDFSQFSSTFQTLQAADQQLTDVEMEELREFVASITFPPNPFRNLDNSLPTRVALPAERNRRGLPMPDGNAQFGFYMFVNTAACRSCHTTPTGLGTDAEFSTAENRWVDFPTGSKGEHHVQTFFDALSTDKSPFKIPQLRSINDKIGFDLSGPVSRAGFGLMHDGHADTLTSFLRKRFGVFFNTDQDVSHVAAFLLAFGGGDLPLGSRTNRLTPPGVTATDVPAGVGHQAILTTNILTPEVDLMIQHARSSTSRVDLIVHNSRRAWLMNGELFLASDNNVTNTLSEVTSDASDESPMVFTFVPQGSGRRFALDRDLDGYYDTTEIALGSDPENASITPQTESPRQLAATLGDHKIRLEWRGRAVSAYTIQRRADLSNGSVWSDLASVTTDSAGAGSFEREITPGEEGGFYRVQFAR